MSARPTYPTPFETRVCSHEWVADARLVGRWMLVVPSAAGVRILTRYGKTHLVAAWQEIVGSGPAIATDLLEWRLLETLPQPASAARVASPAAAPHRHTMWLIIVEALAALGLLIFIVWWTMFSGRAPDSRPDRKAPEAPPDDRP